MGPDIDNRARYRSYMYCNFVILTLCIHNEAVICTVSGQISQSCDFTAHMCAGMILSNYKLFVNPLFKLISIEHVIIGPKTQWKTM